MTRFSSVALAPEHLLDAFDSGEPDLDRWLFRSALHARLNRTAMTFVWTRGDDTVLAYYSLAGHMLVRKDLPERVGRRSPDRIPAILLARLALDRALHGEGLGAELLVDALSRASRAARDVAARFMVVDALHDHAAAFYRHFGFAPVPDQPHRLVQKMSDIEAALGSR